MQGVEMTDNWSDTRSQELREEFNLLSEADLALLVDASVQTVVWWRSKKSGPKFVKLGKAVFYRREDVRDWIESNLAPNAA